LVLLLGACALSRVEAPPPVVAPAAYKEAAGWLRAPAATAVPDAWWTLFKDPQLDELQQRLLIGNENLKAAVAAVASARALADASRSAVLPTLSASLGATRSASPRASAAAAVQNPADSYAATATAAWETDLWGRLAQASAGAQASLQASSSDLAAARLSAQALLVQTYFSLRTADAQLALLERSVAGYRRSLELTQARYHGGVAARSDLLQAQTQLNATLAQAADLTAQRAQLEHALAVLLGLAPAALSLPPQAALPESPQVPTLLPATLLERRPDIAAAQRRVAAAYAQIGVADAAFFPDLVLSANLGWRNASLPRLLSAPSLLWSLGSTLSQSVFDGGQRKLASAQARAAADQATAGYRQLVLTALQEVEDNLVLAEQLQREAQWQAEALQAAQSNLEITLAQYRAGSVAYLNVVAAQSAALSSESSLLAVRNRQLAAVNQLLKNIAGRWEPD
jgi:NodT family efflux transporter outer membrane factor (OMF) lipoprotein